jgi:hypothetical protein
MHSPELARGRQPARAPHDARPVPAAERTTPTSAAILRLQRHAGNCLVSRMLATPQRPAGLRAPATSRTTPAGAAALRLHEHAGNGVMSRMLAAPSRPVLQRLIISGDLDEDDQYAKVHRFLVEKQGAANTTAQLGQPLALTSTNPAEPVYIILHGGQPAIDPESGAITPGTVIHFDPEQLVSKLADMGFSPAEHTGDVYLYSCHSAYTLTAKDLSYAARLAETLKSLKYQGKVHGVTGSVNPLDVPRSGAINVQHLSQSDPTYARLKEMGLVLSLTPGLSDLRDELDPLDDEDGGESLQPVDWKPTLHALANRSMTAIAICNHAIGELDDGYKEISAALGEWREILDGTVAAVIDVFRRHPRTLLVAQLGEEDRETILAALNLILDEPLEAITQQYVKAAKQKGHTMKLLGFYKPLELRTF